MEHSASRTRLETLFHDALEVQPAERSDFLARACADDPHLRGQVLALISAFEQETSFMETPVLENPAPSVSQMLCSLGQILGHYRILQLIGQGGMGDVYLAEDNTLGRKVALKLLPLRLSATKTALARFWLEARSASALNHPNIMTVHAIGEEQGLHYIASEYVEGSTVRQLLSKGPLSLDQILSIALQTASGLAAAHAAGIIHRDIKPENIIVRPDGYLKILDFGLAKLTEDGAALQAAGRDMTTVPGILLGTVGYMSPEQARGLDLDARSDLFSLGTVIYEVATGKCPFTGKTPSDALISILHAEPPALAEAGQFVSPDLGSVVARLLAKDPEKRYQSAAELVTDVQKLQRQLALPVPNFGKQVAWRLPQKLLRPRAMIAMIGIVLLVVLAAVVVFRVRLARDSADHLYDQRAGQQSSQQLAPQKWGFSCRLRVDAAAGRPSADVALPAKGPLHFGTGQRIRLYFSSPETGYLYILNESGKRSEFLTLFPSATSNGGSSLVPAGREIAIPQESWLQFDEEKGTEKIWLVWSDGNLPMLDALSRYANVHDGGRIPSANEKAVRSFLTANYNPEDLDLASSLISGREKTKMLVWRMDLEHD